MPALTTAERYARTASNGRTKIAFHVCDADTLLAAGYAACNNPRKSLALQVYRMQVVGDRGALNLIVGECAALLAGRMARGGAKPLKAHARVEIATQTLKWWCDQACRYCGGHGFHTIEGTPGLGTEECEACHGTGKTPITRAVPPAHQHHASWLAKELDILCAIVIGDMAALLRDDFPTFDAQSGT